MTSTNFFLADLPSEATMTPDIITEACHTLIRNRERYLLNRDTGSILRLLADLGKRWLDPHEPFRQRALGEGPDATGFSAPTIAAGLDQFFGRLTLGNLEAWVGQEFGHGRRLDSLCASEEEASGGRSSTVMGPALIFHICAGNLPNPAWTSILSGLMVRSAQFVKCASGAAFFPRLFGHSLHALDPKLASCLEIAEWKGGSERLEEAAMAAADCVTATGSEKSLAQIGRRIPERKPFLAHGHRLSFSFLSAELLRGSQSRKLAELCAHDICAWDQSGCLSPHVIYVETGGEISPEHFAELLAEVLKESESIRPRGKLTHQESAAITLRRSVYQLRAAQSAETRLWQSQGSTAWTIVFEAEPEFQTSCLNRFVYVKPSAGLDATLHALEPIRGHVSTVGVSGPKLRLTEMALQLGRWGATRVCPIGKMQDPPLAWRHDGRPVLTDLVKWCDLET